MFFSFLILLFLFLSLSLSCFYVSFSFFLSFFFFLPFFLPFSLSFFLTCKVVCVCVRSVVCTCCYVVPITLVASTAWETPRHKCGTCYSCCCIQDRLTLFQLMPSSACVSLFKMHD
jgi:hypothetical protein